jgi:hypothetical protein
MGTSFGCGVGKVEVLCAFAGCEVSFSSPFGETRNGKREISRTKPHVNVGTIGHVDHGKTT